MSLAQRHHCNESSRQQAWKEPRFGPCRGIPPVWVEGRVAGWLLQPQEDAEMPVEVDGDIMVLGRAPLKQRVRPPTGLLRSRLVGLRAPSMPAVKTTGPRPLGKRDFTPRQEGFYPKPELGLG